ncbi:SOS response-associated peptidase [Jiangella asiatica]|uniref:Abasic site processing protein n=1 Tax=Jiangella asiatica TaxID=2530372 RepID=A0A4R5D599_9ACTN|nr:SOS response-associated peptidase [Jiangella asiatica]TDE08612.1 SOS response-associated peptidase [Jiangella asiatica]
MCGRYVVDAGIEDLMDEFAAIAGGDLRDLGRSYNVAPTDAVPVVLERTDQPPEATRQLHAARWGLVPPWAKDVSGGARMINARLETVAGKPAYRGPFARRRCVVPASGYYEWQRLAGGAKQPFYIHPGGGLLAMAGVFEWWRDERLPPDHPDRWVLSASVLTTTPADHLAHIHDRMPAMLSRDQVGDWLNRSNDDTGLLADLARAGTAEVAAALTARPVGLGVGNVRNNHPDLITALS